MFKDKKSLWAMVFGATLLVVAVVAPMLVAPHPDAAHAALNTAEELSDAFIRIAENASPSVVFIEVIKEVSVRRGPMMGPRGLMPEDLFDFFFGPGMPEWPGRRREPQPESRRQVPIGQGSGFIISTDGYIVTNHHVIGDADKVRVKLADNREFEASITGTDPQTEIALIKIDAQNLPALPLGDSDRIRVGEWVVAIGNPFGLTHTVTSGIVSAKGRGNVGIVDYADFIQTDAAINPGNSGGPLLNLRGEVIGMNTAIVSRTGGSLGIGFAIPVNMIKYVESQLRDTGSVERGYLGVSIQNLSADLAQSFGVEENRGVLVGDVQPDSPAAKAGLKRGDIIIEYDGFPVQEIGSFRSRVATTSPGKRVSMVILRDGKRQTINAVVGTLSGEEGGAPATPARPGERTELGLTVQNLTDDLAQRYGYEGDYGVIVTEVAPNSAAAMAGITPGMLVQEINRKRINNTRDFDAAIRDSKEAKTILLLIKDGQYTRYVAIKTE